MNAEQIILLELKLRKHNYPYMVQMKKDNRELISIIQKWLEEGVPYRTIKAKLKELINFIYRNFERDIKETVQEQTQLIAEDLKIKTPLIMGLTINEMIKRRISTHLNIIRKAYLTKEIKLLKMRESFVRSNISIVNQITKVAREGAYNKTQTSSNLYGWMYSSILDRKTSGLCISLSNKVYLKSVYKSRDGLPYVPNVSTHPNCRAMLIPLYSKGEIKKYKELDIFTFAEKYQNEFKKLIGEKKYKLMMEKKLSVSEVFSFKKKSFLTIKEIERL